MGVRLADGFVELTAGLAQSGLQPCDPLGCVCHAIESVCRHGVPIRGARGLHLSRKDTRQREIRRENIAPSLRHYSKGDER